MSRNPYAANPTIDPSYVQRYIAEGQSTAYEDPQKKFQEQVERVTKAALNRPLNYEGMLREKEQQLAQAKDQLRKALTVLYNIPQFPTLSAEDQTQLSNDFNEIFVNQNMDLNQVGSLGSLLLNPALAQCLERQNQLEAEIDALVSVKEQNAELQTRLAELEAQLQTPRVDPYELLELQQTNANLQQRLNDTDAALEEAQNLVKALRAQPQQVNPDLVLQLDQCNAQLKECRERNDSARKTAEEMSQALQIKPGRVADQRIALEALEMERKRKETADLAELLRDCQEAKQKLTLENKELAQRLAQKQESGQTFDAQTFIKLEAENQRLNQQLAEAKTDLEKAIREYQANTGDVQLCYADIETLQGIVRDLASQKQKLISIVRELLAAGRACSAIEGFENVFGEMSENVKEELPVIRLAEQAPTLVKGSGFYRRPDYNKLLEEANRIPKADS